MELESAHVVVVSAGGAAATCLAHECLPDETTPAGDSRGPAAQAPVNAIAVKGEPRDPVCCTLPLDTALTGSPARSRLAYLDGALRLDAVLAQPVPDGGSAEFERLCYR